MLRFLLLLAFPLLWLSTTNAQSVRLNSITNNCNTFNFCATGVPSGTDAVVWRRNGVDQPRRVGTTCISLPGPFETIQAFFQTAVVTPFGTFYQPNGNTPVISRPNIGPVTINGGSGYQAVCQNTFASITLTAASCVPSGNWTMTGIQTLYQATSGGPAIQASVDGVSSGITSRGTLTIQASGSWRPNCSYSIGIQTVDELGNISNRTYIAYTTNSCFFYRDATDEELSLLENAERTPDGQLSAGAQADLRAVVADLSQAPGSERTDVPLSVFPNPTGGQLTVRHGGTPTELRVVDLTGRSVLRVASGQLGEQYTRMDVSQLPTGLYLVEATFAGGIREVTKVQVSR